MTQPAWHAFYYEGMDNGRPPLRTEWIEAASETEAAQIARGRMGRCLRVELMRPRWESSQQPIVVICEAALATAPSRKMM